MKHPGTMEEKELFKIDPVILRRITECKLTCTSVYLCLALTDLSGSKFKL